MPMPFYVKRAGLVYILGGAQPAYGPEKSWPEIIRRRAEDSHVNNLPLQARFV